MTIPAPISGMFPNTMAFARWGDGPRTLLVIPVASLVPTAATVRLLAWPLRPLIGSGCSLWMVNRRQGMPQGHTIEDMADDYADLIAAEFQGRVDLVVGMSMGGLIGQYLAANHPDRFGHIALVAAGHTISERGIRLNYDVATALGQQDHRKARRLLADELLSDSLMRWTAPAIRALMGVVRLPHHHEFSSDVMIEVAAQAGFDSRSVLPRIRVPVLLIAGDRDLYFPVEVVAETDRLIPECTLSIYRGKGHVGVVGDRRLASDICSFAECTPAAPH